MNEEKILTCYYKLIKKVLKLNFRIVILKFLRRIFKRMFHSEGINDIKKSMLKRFFISINRNLIEKGRAPFWIFTKQECLNFWSKITNEEKFSGNRPDEYAKKDKAIISFLDEFLKPYIRQANSILEIGCNCGANLQYLMERVIKIYMV